MAICDYCGSSYRGGSIKEGPYRYCTGLCRDRGMKILQHLEGMPADRIEDLILQAHRGPCPKCSRNVSVDVHTSYRFRSALIFLSGKEQSFVSCSECARKTQRDDLGFTIISGWWSPPGILITPFAVAFQLVAMRRPIDAENPSDRFRKLVKLRIAQSRAALMTWPSNFRPAS
jgi:hypothetical protein